LISIDFIDFFTIDFQKALDCIRLH